MTSLMESLARVWNIFQGKVVYFFPRLLAALVVLVIGWGLAIVLQSLVRRVLKLLQFDVRCERSGFSALIRRVEIAWTPTETAAKLVFCGTLLSAAVLSLSAMEMVVLDRLVSEFFLYVPNLLVAALILVLGFVMGNFLSRAVLLSSINKELPSPRLLALTVRLLVNLLAFAMALEQLGIARNTVTVTFAIAFGGLMLGLALAFGLGGKDLAREVLERRFSKKEQDGGDILNQL